MQKYIKFLYLTILVVTASYVFFFIKDNFNAWRSIYNVQKENGEKAASIRSSTAWGELFSYGRPNFYDVPCANSKGQALEFLTDELRIENESKTYFDQEIRPLLDNTQIENDGYFYKLILPEGVISSRHSKNISIFDCRFFDPAFDSYILSGETTEDRLLGTLNKGKNEEELGKLVNYLTDFNIIDLRSLGKNIEINESETQEINGEIVRIDSGVYSETSGLLANPDNYIVKITYKLDIETGEVRITKTVE